MTNIKICGLTNVRDAVAAADAGASMIGLNFYPRSARYVASEVAREIVEELGGTVECVAILVDANPNDVRRIAERTGIRTVQLHGTATAETCTELRGDFRVIRALTTHADFSEDSTRAFAECDLLLDAHHPKLRGGTGLVCDWNAARAVRKFARFLILSGGLNERNVANAIATVAPDAVDVCSGVESAPGVKDHDAMARFVAAVSAAQDALA